MMNVLKHSMYVVGFFLCMASSYVTADDFGATTGSSACPISEHYRVRIVEDDDDGTNQRRVLSTTSSIPEELVVVVHNGGEMEAGPFPYTNDLYSPNGDMLADANGRPGVLEGIPVALNFVLYAVQSTNKDSDNDDGSATATIDQVVPLEGADIFCWNADATGYYSNVDFDGTYGQSWLRAKATSDVDGKLSFSTILPGWYTGRAIHWHVRVRLPGEDDFYLTTQLFILDDFLKSYLNYGIYGRNENPITWIDDDILFLQLQDDIKSLLTLTDFHGNNDDGYTATFHIGIDANDLTLPKAAKNEQPSSSSLLLATPLPPSVAAPSRNKEEHVPAAIVAVVVFVVCAVAVVRALAGRLRNIQHPYTTVGEASVNVQAN